MRQLFLPMRIWDLPTRLFHWVLVALVFLAWLSSEMVWMRVHIWCGLTIIALLLFRLIWGFIGSDTARFTFFIQSPLAAIRHLLELPRREPDTEIGHNAAGGWMVLVMLGVLAIQASSGLFANDDISTEGPLATWIGKDRSDWLTHVHRLNFMAIEIVVALHVLAIVMYRVVKGHNLLTPMITGKKRLPGATPAPRMMHPVLGLIIFALCAVAVLGFAKLAG